MGEECCGHDHSSENVLEATIIDDSVGSSFDFSKRLDEFDSRYLLGGGVAVVAIVLMLVFSTLWTAAGPSMVGGDDDDWWNTPVNERHKMDLNMTSLRSQLPEAGPYTWSGPTEHYVEVDLPPSEQDVGFPGPALMHIALWMPDVPNGTQVPVIATIHPYYDFGGEGVAGDDSNPNTIPDAGIGA